MTLSSETQMKACLLLWSDGVKRSIFKEIIDIVVIDLDVGHENAVATVFVHILRFACLLRADHVLKLRVCSLLPKKQIQKKSNNFKFSYLKF